MCIHILCYDRRGGLQNSLISEVGLLFHFVLPKPLLHTYINAIMMFCVFVYVFRFRQFPVHSVRRWNLKECALDSCQRGSKFLKKEVQKSQGKGLFGTMSHGP